MPVIFPSGFRIGAALSAIWISTPSRRRRTVWAARLITPSVARTCADRVVDRRSGFRIEDGQYCQQRLCRRFRQIPAGQLFRHRIHADNAACGIRGNHRIADRIEQCLQIVFALAQCQIVIGLLRELIGNQKQRFAHPLETFRRHHRHFQHRRPELDRISADFPGIGQHPLLVQIGIPYLADQPVGNMAFADADAGAAIPEPAAETRLKSGTGKIFLAQNRIRTLAISQPEGRPPNNIAAKPTEVAGPSQRLSMCIGNNRSHSGGMGKRILNCLQPFPADQ